MGHLCPIRSTSVTRQNFGALLEHIRAHIQDADFVALGTGLTGVHRASWRSSHMLDTCETNYHKLKDSAQNFGLWEFGICPFKWMEADRRYVAHPYNFYLFPRDELKVKLKNDSFLCQTASLEFLVKHGFDFNTCIQNGLPHISREQESTVGMRLNFQAEDYATVHTFGRFRRERGDLEMNFADKLFSDQIREKLMYWRNTLKTKKHTHDQTRDASRSIGRDNCIVKEVLQREVAVSKRGDKLSDRLITSSVIWHKSCESLCLPHESLTWESLAHHELLVLLEVLKLDFNDLVVIVQPQGFLSTRRKVHVFYTESYEERVHLMEELECRENRKKERELAEAVGFRLIIDAVVESKKLVVGHHCLLDFAHIYESFFKTLPSTTAEFAAGLLENFPRIIDTQYLMKNIPQLQNEKEMLLSVVYSKIFGRHADGRCRVKVEIPDELNIGKSLRLSAEKRSMQEKHERHDAGSTAYMAGCLFAQICNLTNTDFSHVSYLPKHITSGGKTGLGRFMNLMCMNEVISSVLDLSTGCESLEILDTHRPLNYSNVALVWGYPCGTSPVLVKSLIKQALKFNHPFSVFPVDDSSTFIKFECSEATEVFFTLIQRLPKGSVLGDNLLAGGIRAARFAAYEFLCKSSLSRSRLADCAKYLPLGFSDK